MSDGSFCHDCRKPQHECLCIDDVMLDIREAVSEALKQTNAPGDHKQITDRVVDLMPDYYRRPIQNCM